MHILLWQREYCSTVAVDGDEGARDGGRGADGEARRTRLPFYLKHRLPQDGGLASRAIVARDNQ